MPLESAIFINDLNPANPPGTDPKSQGDDHLRLGKTTAKNSFAGFTGAVLVTGVDGGVANAYTLTPAWPLPAYTPRTLVEFSPTAPNTGASTMNISGLGVRNLVSVSGAALSNNELLPGVKYVAVDDGTQLRLLTVTKTYVDSMGGSGSLPGQSKGVLVSDGTLASFSKSLITALNFAKAADVASSATPDIWAGDGNTMHITGTTGITGFASAPQAGATRWLIFDAAVLLTNSANLVIMGSQNYTTAAGDYALVIADTPTKFSVLLFPSDGLQANATPYLYVRDEVASGAASGNSVGADITQTRRLNTVVSNSITGASLASNTITLPPGTYRVSGRSPAVQVSQTKIFLYNVTDSTYVLNGSSAFAANATVGTTVDSFIRGEFTITAQKNFTLRHWTQQAITNGLGTAASVASMNEVYSELEFWKVA